MTASNREEQIPNLKPQIPQISQIRGEGKTVSANYIFFQMPS